jgi:hypothetical protein
MKFQKLGMALGAFALMAGTSVFSARAEARERVQIGFREVGHHPVQTSPLPVHLLAAADRFNDVYAAEAGVVGLASSPNGALLVLCRNRRDSSRIWNLMLSRRDAGVENGVAVFYFGEAEIPEPVLPHFGTLYLDEGSQGSLRVPGGQSQFIYGYKVTVHQSCSVSNSGVQATGPVQKTQLRKSATEGHLRAYYYTVNGGIGAEVTAIVVGLQPSDRIFIKDSCQVDVFAQY